MPFLPAPDVPYAKKAPWWLTLILLVLTVHTAHGLAQNLDLRQWFEFDQAYGLPKLVAQELTKAMEVRALLNLTSMGIFFALFYTFLSHYEVIGESYVRLHRDRKPLFYSTLLIFLAQASVLVLPEFHWLTGLRTLTPFISDQSQLTTIWLGPQLLLVYSLTRTICGVVGRGKVWVWVLAGLAIVPLMYMTRVHGENLAFGLVSFVLIQLVTSYCYLKWRNFGVVFWAVVIASVVMSVVLRFVWHLGDLEFGQEQFLQQVLKTN